MLCIYNQSNDGSSILIDFSAINSFDVGPRDSFEDLICVLAQRDPPDDTSEYQANEGSHYTSRKFRQTLWQCQIKQSMIRRGNCWGNAPMERFLDV